MNENAARELVGIGIRLVDDAYLAWLSAESESERALKAWCNGTGAGPGAAYLAYRAALDREDAAARDLQRLCELTDPCRETLVFAGEGVRERVRE